MGLTVAELGRGAWEPGAAPQIVATALFALSAREIYGHAGGAAGSESTRLDLRR